MARALYSGPQLLILDEATSSLDSFTEKKIAKSIKKLKHKLTIIIVAHRLSTLDDCDKVFYIENGTIKDSGSLSDLLLKNKDLNWFKIKFIKMLKYKKLFFPSVQF